VPVATISDELGFDEATNFVKFFRRETEQTPRAFRAAHALVRRSVQIHGGWRPANSRR